MPRDLTPNDIQRFWSKVDMSAGPDGCWPYLETKPGIHGRFHFGQERDGSHRIAYRLCIGAIPAGLLICHTCDNPPCCNPAHLFAGTTQDNTADCLAKGRHASCAARGKGIPKELFHQGAEHPMAKLDERQVREIRERYAAGDVSQRALARLYGIKQPQVSSIVRGAKWKHVE